MSEYEHAGGGGGVVFWVDPSSAQVLISAFLVRAQILPRRAAASARFCTVTRRRWLVGWRSMGTNTPLMVVVVVVSGDGWCRMVSARSRMPRALSIPLGCCVFRVGDDGLATKLSRCAGLKWGLFRGVSSFWRGVPSYSNFSAPFVCVTISLQASTVGGGALGSLRSGSARPSLLSVPPGILTPVDDVRPKRRCAQRPTF